MMAMLVRCPTCNYPKRFDRVPWYAQPWYSTLLECSNAECARLYEVFGGITIDRWDVLPRIVVSRVDVCDSVIEVRHQHWKHLYVPLPLPFGV